MARAGTTIHVSAHRDYVLREIKACGASSILANWTGTDAEAVQAVLADSRTWFAFDCPTPRSDGGCPGHRYPATLT
jgi:hypothetical protein